MSEFLFTKFTIQVEHIALIIFWNTKKVRSKIRREMISFRFQPHERKKTPPNLNDGSGNKNVTLIKLANTIREINYLIYWTNNRVSTRQTLFLDWLIFTFDSIQIRTNLSKHLPSHRRFCHRLCCGFSIASNVIYCGFPFKQVSKKPDFFLN